MEEGAGPRQEISKGPTFAQEVGKSRLPHTGLGLILVAQSKET